MRVNQSIVESKKFQIPMVVTDEVIRDFRIKPKDVTWRRIGNRKCRVVMVDATEAEYKAYMEPVWAEIKREDRDGRCMVQGKNGRLIRCPESNRCEDCERSSEVCRERNKTASLSFLVDEGAEPTAEGSFEDDIIYETILEIGIATCAIFQNEKVKLNYLYYYLLFRQSDLIHQGIGGAQPNISQTILKKLPIAYPVSLDLQDGVVARIEELFSQLDASVNELRTAKERLKVYRQAVLKEAFGGVQEKMPIKKVAEFVTSGSRGWAKYYADKGARFIRITDLTRDRIQLKNNSVQYVILPDIAEGKRSRLKKGDVLVSITADLGSIGFIADEIGEAYINQHIAMIRLENAMQGEYMAWYLKSEFGQKDLLKNKRGGGKLGLGLDDIRDTPVPVVDNITALNTVMKINQRLSVCDNIEQTVDTALQQAEVLRQSILKKAFEGTLL